MPTPGHSKAAIIYFDAFRLSQIVMKAGQEIKAPPVSVTPIEPASGWEEHVPGKVGGGSSCSGVLDVDATGWDKKAFDALTDGAHLFTRLPVGGAAGGVAYLTKEIAIGEPRAFDQAQVVMLDWSGQMTEAVARGQVLTPSTLVSATGPQTGRNVGTTASTQTLVAHVLLLAVTGPGSVTVAIQESSDNGAGDAYATVSGMSAALTSAGQAARLTFTGATETWKRSNITALTFTNATLLVAIGTAA